MDEALGSVSAELMFSLFAIRSSNTRYQRDPKFVERDERPFGSAGEHRGKDVRRLRHRRRGRGLTRASFALCAHAVTMSALHIKVLSAMRGTREPEPGANECGWSECYQGRLADFIPLAEQVFDGNE